MSITVQEQHENETALRIQRIRAAVAEARSQGPVDDSIAARDGFIEIPFSELEWLRDD